MKFDPYKGRRRQRGYGLGSVFSSLFRRVAPLLKRGAMTLGKQALKTGVNVANDVLQGDNIGEAFKNRATASAKRLGRKALQKAIDYSGDTIPTEPRVQGRRARKRGPTTAEIQNLFPADNNKRVNKRRKKRH